MKSFILNITLLILLIFLLPACTFKKLRKAKDKDPNSIEMLLKYPFEVKRMKLSNDIEIAYTDEGKSKTTPILYLHDIGGYMRSWDKSYNGLRHFHRSIRVDLPGYGKSSKDNIEGNMIEYADLMKAFLSKLKINKVVVMGHGMGGQIAMTMALKYPNLVEKLVLINPTGFENYDNLQKRAIKESLSMSEMKRLTEGLIRRNFEMQCYRKISEAKYIVQDRLKIQTASDFDKYAKIIIENTKSMIDQNLYEQLANIRKPTICFFSKMNNYVPQRLPNSLLTPELVAKDGSKKLQKCELEMFTDAGHYAQWEKAWYIYDKLKVFLKS
jgi:pimeloyl-ACP methyl ester carboxylesterase